MTRIVSLVGDRGVFNSKARMAHGQFGTGSTPGVTQAREGLSRARISCAGRDGPETLMPVSYVLSCEGLRLLQCESDLEIHPVTVCAPAAKIGYQAARKSSHVNSQSCVAHPGLRNRGSRPQPMPHVA